jgi:predicted nucleic acid-binding Zn ribbon protein
MPTYVYKFIDTGETIEVQQAFSDDSLTEAEHPETGAMMAVRKVFTPVGVTFKGGGFYKTDSRGSSSKSTTAGSSGSSGSTSSSDSSSSSSSSGGSSTPAPSTAASGSGSSGSGSSSSSSSSD